MLVPLCHLQQEIAEASNDAARKYYDKTPKEERFNTGVTAIMRVVALSKQQSFKGQFFKYLVIANPKFGDNFLQEVSASLLTPW
jgi:phosphoenolpyruvate synthase/pyruvate phosphate dikinase